MLEMRTSERRALKSCSQQWYWQSVEGLRPKTEKTALWFGSAVHEALAEWYVPGVKRGAHPVETFNRVLDGERSTIVTDEDDENEYVSARELGVDMLTRYVDHYGSEPKKEYLVSEFAGNVLLKRPEMRIMGQLRPEERRWLKYHFTYDGVYRDLETGEVWLDEHKTAASIWDDMIPLDDQAGSYWAFAGHHLRKAGLLKRGEGISGIMYNFLRKAMADTRPRNAEGLYMNKATTKQHYLDALEHSESFEELTGKETLKTLQELCEEEGITATGDVSASQPPPYFERHPAHRNPGERKTMIRRIQNEAVFAEAYRSGDLPITKNPSTNNCRMCAFKRMCELDESGDKLSVEEMKQSLYNTVDPYEAYR